jgi:hypothetical protein
VVLANLCPGDLFPQVSAQESESVVFVVLHELIGNSVTVGSSRSSAGCNILL